MSTASRFELEQRIAGEWENVSDGGALSFASHREACAALSDHLASLEQAGMDFDVCDFRIARDGHRVS